MDIKEAAKEIVTTLENLKPNEVVTLSPKAGELLIETVHHLNKN